MVVNLIIDTKPKCDRCGADRQEAQLTRSHAPHSGLLKIASLPQMMKQRLTRVYILCERCRQVHYELERQMIAKMCIEIANLHEDYLNQ